MGGAVLKPSSKYIYDEAVTRIQAAFDHYDKDSNGEIDKDVSQSRLALYTIVEDLPTCGTRSLNPLIAYG